MMTVTRIEIDFGDGISGGIGKIELAWTRRRRFPLERHLTRVAGRAVANPVVGLADRLARHDVRADRLERGVRGPGHVEQNRTRLARANVEAALVRQRQPTGGDMRLQREVGIGSGRGPGFALETIEHDKAALRRVGARGDAQRGLVAGSERRIIMAAG